MGYADVIAREAQTLPLEKQAEILDFIAFLKTRQLATVLPVAPKTVGEIEALFKNVKVDVSHYVFNRDDANAR